MNPEAIEQRLRTLKNLNDLRGFFRDLGYEYADQPIPTRNFKPELLDRIEADSLAVVAAYAGYPVLFCRLKTARGRTRERSRLRTERLLLRAVPSQYTECLLVTLAGSSGLWHFVNSKPFGDKLRLRRFVVGPGEKLRTAAERLGLIAVETGDDWATLLDKHESAFDREVVSDGFFQEYRRIFTAHKVEIAARVGDEHVAHNFLQLFLNRLMFIYFIQRKGWLGSNGNAEFVKTMWDSYRAGKYPANTFYEKWLAPLFFSALNNKRDYLRKGLPAEIEYVFEDAPFLNGGLFRMHVGVDDVGVVVSDDLFAEVFDNLLDRYNFTVQEDTPFDQSVSVDPEMLGIVYEKLVNLSDAENEQAASGIFYTPRVEVDFMCRRSLLEYLAKHSDTPRETLYHLLFDEETDDPTPLDKTHCRQLRQALLGVGVVDPACGSGAFLVGMMQVILDIEQRLSACDRHSVDVFDEKKRIIERSLYGVDVKDWAIGVAQLRLWLSLIVDADEKKLDLPARKRAGEALLPSLGFKIREGDSLVQEIAGRPFPVRGHTADMTEAMRKQIDDLRELKTDFFFNRTRITEQALHDKERQFYLALIERETKQLRDDLDKLQRPRERLRQEALFETKKGKQADLTLVEEENQRVEEKIKEIRARLLELEAQQADLANAKRLFWGIEFAEIFYGDGRRGFDIVIGNPPYVKTQRIKDPRPESNTRLLPYEYKAALKRMVALDVTDWNVRIDGKSDLYLYFYFRCFSLLNNRGTFCFITSNSWLDADYGVSLQEYLSRRVLIHAIYDNEAKRSFKHADINTVIVLLGLQDARCNALNNVARFIMVTVPYEQAVTAEYLMKLEDISRPTSMNVARVYPIRQDDLLNDGQEAVVPRNNEQVVSRIAAKYEGGKWGGKYLRAPSVFHVVMEKARFSLVPFSQVASVETYLILPKKTDQVIVLRNADVPTNLSKYFKPFVRSPRYHACPLLSTSEFSIIRCTKRDIETNHVLRSFVEESKDDLFRKYKVRYSGYRWCQFDQEPAPILWQRRFANRHICYFNPKLFFSYDFYRIRPLFGTDEAASRKLLSAMLSSLFWFVKELYGRTNLGQGALKTEGTDLAKMLIINPSTLHFPEDVFVSLINRESLDVTSELVQEDRRELDRVVFDAIGLTASERRQVYEAVEKLVIHRSSKAVSLN